MLSYGCYTEQMLNNPQRNDAFDPYGTYPIHQRPATKDNFAEGVQHTQYVHCTFFAATTANVKVDNRS